MASLDSDSFYSLLYSAFTMPTMMFVKCQGDCPSVQLGQCLAIVYMSPREFKECCPSLHSEFELGLDLLSPDFDGFPSTFSWLFPVPYSVFF